MSCTFCKEPSVESFEVEGGNNAELTCEISLCESHFKEYEKDEYTFLTQHAQLIDELCYDALIWEAE